MTIYDNYLETKILSSDPLELINALYCGAVNALGLAREHLRTGAIRERSRQITRAWEIVNELRVSLDHERGGEISQRLAALYAYMQERLIEANATQTDAPLAEVQGYLATLREAWCAIRQAPLAPAGLPEPVCVAC
jgi:flagellar protein FliS